MKERKGKAEVLFVAGGRFVTQEVGGGEIFLRLFFELEGFFGERWD